MPYVFSYWTYMAAVRIRAVLRVVQLQIVSLRRRCMSRAGCRLTLLLLLRWNVVSNEMYRAAVCCVCCDAVVLVQFAGRGCLGRCPGLGPRARARASAVAPHAGRGGGAARAARTSLSLLSRVVARRVKVCFYRTPVYATVVPRSESEHRTGACPPCAFGVTVVG